MMLLTVHNATVPASFLSVVFIVKGKPMKKLNKVKKCQQRIIQQESACNIKKYLP
jgi:hypothetical protein